MFAAVGIDPARAEVTRSPVTVSADLSSAGWSVAGVQEGLARAGFNAHEVLPVAELVVDPHLEARGFLLPLEHPGGAMKIFTAHRRRSSSWLGQSARHDPPRAAWAWSRSSQPRRVALSPSLGDSRHLPPSQMDPPRHVRPRSHAQIDNAAISAAQDDAGVSTSSVRDHSASRRHRQGIPRMAMASDIDRSKSEPPNTTRRQRRRRVIHKRGADGRRIVTAPSGEGVNVGGVGLARRADRYMNTKIRCSRRTPPKPRRSRRREPTFSSTMSAHPHYGGSGKIDTAIDAALVVVRRTRCATAPNRGSNSNGTTPVNVQALLVLDRGPPVGAHGPIINRQAARETGYLARRSPASVRASDWPRPSPSATAHRPTPVAPGGAPQPRVLVIAPW